MNRLASATSPYLLQHANNPVAWWELTEAAFAEAKRRDVPVLISVGYSSIGHLKPAAQISVGRDTGVGDQHR